MHANNKALFSYRGNLVLKLDLFQKTAPDGFVRKLNLLSPERRVTGHTGSSVGGVGQESRPEPLLDNRARFP